MDLGFKQAGFKILWANDFYNYAVDTYKKNIGDHIVQGNIQNIPSDDIPNDPDVLLGGFPCQGFSVANTKRDPNDDRNFLYKEMVRVIKDKKPKWVVIWDLNTCFGHEIYLESFSSILLENTRKNL